jgi:hypothetical protein
MARLVDLIREGTAPASMTRRAAQGKLSVPAVEAIEILVALAADRELGAEAERTLEAWDERSLTEVCSSAATSPEVLQHLLECFQHRAWVITSVCENPALPITALEKVAARAELPMLEAMLQSSRARGSGRLLKIMAMNPAAEPVEAKLNHCLEMAEANEAEEVAEEFLAEHAEEVQKTDTQSFELVAGSEGEDDALDKLLQSAKTGEAPAKPEEVEQLSILQKIGRMRVGERIKMAMKGNREERMILIRDRSKLVAMAVLESPKVTDMEMEGFAAMKNVQESVLRAISKKRNCMKVYGVVRALVNNPKTPLDTTMPLVAHLLVKDQRALAINKNVNETLRKMAIRIYRNNEQGSRG